MRAAGTRLCAALALSLVLGLTAVSAAQEGAPAARDTSPPKGPADIIGGAMRQRASREMQQATQRGSGATTAANEQAPAPAPDQAPVPSAPEQGQAPSPSAGASPHGPGAHPGMDSEEALPPIATEAVEPNLPVGTVQIRVLDPQGRVAANADVSLGIMDSDGQRTSKNAKTNADGLATFAQLAVGDKQAYRVNVPYRRAKYSSNPFRLPQRGGGYRVEIRELPVTTDDRLVVLYMGATSLELKDDRIKIVQQARVLNLGRETYVFPEKGTLVKFPKGYLAMQSEEVMTDQKIAEVKGEGVRITGSLTPGEVTLLWGFDLPLEGSEADVAIGLPWLTFAYRVISDAPQGMSLQVAGLPEPIVHEEGGRRMLVTEVQLKVGDPRLSELKISLRGIPGPGPARWVAAALALLLLLAGIAFAIKPVARDAAGAPRLRGEEIEARKRELLVRARELHAQRASEEIGPQFHAEQLELIRDELAALLLAGASVKPERSAASS